MKSLSKTLAVVLVLVLALPAIAQVSDEDIDRARREVNAILADSEALGIEVQEAWARQFSLEKEITDLSSSIEVARVKISDAEQRLQEVAVEMYMGSTSVASIQVLFAATDEEYGAGIEYLRNVSGVEDDVVNQLRSFRTELGRQTDRLAEASAEQEILAAELEVKATELQGQLVQAQGVYEGLVQQQAAEEEARRQAEEARRLAAEEAARNATTTTTPSPTTTGGGSGEATTTTTTTPTETTTPEPPPPPSSGGGACPVAGAVSFSDSWGAPRSGGRAHQGVDMMAARNTPLVAIYSGTIRRITTGNLSGLSVWLRASNGDTFFYAHLESYGDISVGQSVTEGQVIGYNGSSGNAPPWLPHVHFEYHPGGGSAVNPYPLVRSLC